MLERTPAAISDAENRLAWLLRGKPWTVTSSRGEEFPQRLVRILSIDGGGIRGIIPALLLQRIEEQAGAPISELFDIVAGTSTGGLLAMGLTTPTSDDPSAPRYSAAEIVDVYRRRGSEIFHRSLRYRLRSLDGLRRPKYPPQGLKRVLDEMFGGARLSQSVRQTLVTAYCTERRLPTVLSSAGARQQRNPDVICAEAARATSAAPTFFPPFQLRDKTPGKGQDQGPFSLVDGGVLANNPAMYAWYESKTSHGESSVLMVSLGTGVCKADFPYDSLRKRGSLLWLGPILELLMSANSEATHNQLSYLLNGRWHDPTNSNELTSVAVDDGGFDVNSGDLIDRHWYSRYLRYQVPLRTAASQMDNASPANIRRLEADTAAYLRTRSEGTTEQSIGDDLDDLAGILRDLSIIRPAFPNGYSRPAARSWQHQLDFMEQYARALEEMDEAVPAWGEANA